MFSLAIITSFHASMRTMLTPLLWGVCCADFIIFDKKKYSNRKGIPLHVQQKVRMNVVQA
jgi:hypothetical protein